MTFHSKFHWLEIMHSDIISIYKKMSINKKFSLRMAKPFYLTHIIMEKNDNSHIFKSRTTNFTSSIVEYAIVFNLRFQLFSDSDNNISLPHTRNYILQLLSLIQLSISILLNKLWIGTHCLSRQLHTCYHTKHSIQSKIWQLDVISK